jgi:hypothetical protein
MVHVVTLYMRMVESQLESCLVTDEQPHVTARISNHRYSETVTTHASIATAPSYTLQQQRTYWKVRSELSLKTEEGHLLTISSFDLCTNGLVVCNSTYLILNGQVQTAENGKIFHH